MYERDSVHPCTYLVYPLFVIKYQKRDQSQQKTQKIYKISLPGFFALKPEYWSRESHFLSG